MAEFALILLLRQSGYVNKTLSFHLTRVEFLLSIVRRTVEIIDLNGLDRVLSLAVSRHVAVGRNNFLYHLAAGSRSSKYPSANIQPPNMDGTRHDRFTIGRHVHCEGFNGLLGTKSRNTGKSQIGRRLETRILIGKQFGGTIARTIHFQIV